MSRENAHDPRALANKILDIRSEAGQPLTIMQLIKLIYISDGWALTLLGRPLSREVPQAWQYGPVYPTVYRAFSGIGSRPVDTRAYVKGTSVPITEEMGSDEENLMREVVASYGKLSAYALSNLTHQPNTPWSKAYDKGLYTPINDQDMRDHFESLKETRLVKNTTAA
ncbi:DUF4065 domain-containing protein [Sphingobium terrigena]|uniref:DUF4065 domain-containing protein n=1 Tax=Sphingobium terrigena TaxID=2304063 RepID=A0A418YRP9_9SPHN|nr:type II toxin-antitoxin system antitoxin SocA domain-containing protein [Sphingobium terrigena]RJG54341.1 DUF4065 domain-containing protein [Sphingobium terrigena]